ncbi:16S rRNA (cytidine1402-2'-O)-methyltransferase [Thermotomaculum hydrothermale]|uniref:16S rRNA (Cytidine1402-2'-O)-methyltransferase n=1 Tax=Thermotomaculum hydrothermale TaxID=981385 RepID=A0A7R6PVQ3_9BACT|nr:SAM-dependent methyltransferase [Thermotomaculum hydrothermale]BBB33507.1 16S rRNA (cytidine1402-2'-O)-methyltransferase [Thermotomaculum hydrothermale]
MVSEAQVLNKLKSGLYLVSVPMGNPEDITLRGLRILKKADVVYGEERKAAYRLIRSLGIKRSDLEFLNEHNEEQKVEEIKKAVIDGKSVAYFSDAGAPVFSDPGLKLVKAFREWNLPVTFIPGASSLMSGIALSGFNMNEFYFAGFLPRKNEERKKKLEELKKLKVPIFIMETPYRLQQLLKAIKNTFGKDKRISILFNLTCQDEEVIIDTVGNILKIVGEEKNRKPFVLVIEGRNV